MPRICAIAAVIIGLITLASVASESAADDPTTQSATADASAKPAAADRISVAVDPRVELLSIVFRLAGNPEYNTAPDCPYRADVERQFGPHRDHAVIALAQRLRSTRGVSYDAVMSYAVHITPPPELQPRIPFDRHPERLDQRWHPDEAAEFLTQLRDFAATSGFERFWVAHERLYADAAERMQRQLAKRDYLTWFNRYFGARPAADFHLYLGLLNGGNCYGVGIRFPDGREEITPVIGVWQWDSAGVPEFDDSMVPTIVHEFCHSYTNPIVDRHFQELQPAADRLYKTCADTMSAMAYGNARTMLYESFVRACVIRNIAATEGGPAAAMESMNQFTRGFTWVGEFAQLLTEYESHRDKYKTLDDFMPQIVAFFESAASKAEQQAEDAPHVVAMTPANGATDVDPSLKTMTITFDRPMQDKMWSIVGGGPHFPKITGEIHYDATRRILTVPIELQPNWTYDLWLNRGQYMSFRAESGTPLAPMHVAFGTAGSH